MARISINSASSMKLITAVCLAVAAFGCSQPNRAQGDPQKVTVFASAPALTIQENGYRINEKERIEALASEWNLCRQLSLQMLQANQAEGLFCPVSFYLTLPAVAASSSDQLQSELFSFLGETKDSDFIRFREIQDLVNIKAENVQCQTATSTWANEKYPVTDFEKKIAKECQQGLYQGKWDQSLGDAWAEWINDHTNSMLEEAVKEDQEAFKSPDMKRLICNTLYFHSDWRTKFNPEETKEGIFYGKTEEKAEFMNMSTSNLFVRKDAFSAVQLPMNDRYALWAVLPEEGTELGDLLGSPALSEFLDHPFDGETRSFNMILQVPKLTVKAELQPEVFEEVMQEYGVRLSLDKIQIKQNAALNLDESGTEFAAYTETFIYMGPGPENEPILMRFDRPFLIYICGPGNIPVAIGAINTTKG